VIGDSHNSSERLIEDWGRRVSAARARLTTEIRDVDDVSPLRRESHVLLDELRIAFEELQVAEEELHVQTEELTSSRVALERERQRYRTLFEHAPVPYIITNEYGIIMDLNQAAARLLRVAHDELLTKPLVVFVPTARRQVFRDQMAAFGTTDTVVGLHLRIRPRGGKTRNVTASVGVVREKGSVIELRWLLVDETARRRREKRVKMLNTELTRRVDERTAELRRAAELNEEATRAAEVARQAAERASREKTDLIAIVSHELRTPLAAIGGYAELLALDLRGPLNPAQRADIARIQDAQAHILRLVDDLVGYSKLETGRLRFEIGDVIVRDAVSAVVLLIRPQAAARHITVELLSAETAVVARADEERLRQIVLNLLSNAVKFTPVDGHVSVTWSGDDTRVAIEIRDNGIGIPPEKLEAVFEPYVQLNAARSSGSGWGLGLAISRELARAMGGDITASSSPEDGTAFTLTLPRSIRIASDDLRD
jgi:PAS domain S-box-containing protein